MGRGRGQAEYKISKDSLGDRMKGYEDKTKTFISPKSLTIVRLDGRSFHTWTKGLKRPYDEKLIEAMIDSTNQLCEELSGAVIGYTQSDEASILLSDNQKETSQAVFSGNVQKIASVSASAMTGYFNKHFPDRPLAMFDARVFTVPSKIEAMNYFIWRQKDAQRNAISMLAENYFSPKELHGVSTQKRKQMLEQKGLELESVNLNFRQGTLLQVKQKEEKVRFFNKRKAEWEETKEPVKRSYWDNEPAESFRVEEGNIIWEAIPDYSPPQPEMETNES